MFTPIYSKSSYKIIDSVSDRLIPLKKLLSIKYDYGQDISMNKRPNLIIFLHETGAVYWEADANGTKLWLKCHKEPSHWLVYPVLLKIFVATMLRLIWLEIIWVLAYWWAWILCMNHFVTHYLKLLLHNICNISTLPAQMF